MTNCNKQYKKFSKKYKKYLHGGSKDKFVEYFTKLFLKSTNDNNLQTRIRNLPFVAQGRVAIPDDLETLLTQLMDNVYDKMTNECPRYAEKYDSIIDKVSYDLRDAIRGITPKHINHLVRNEIDPDKALTLDQFKEFIAAMKAKTVPTRPKAFKPGDVANIIDLMIEIQAKSLSVDTDVIRPLILVILDEASTGKKEDTLKKHETEIKKWGYKGMEEPSIERLDKLLKFYRKVFPKAKEVANNGGFEAILKSAQTDKDTLDKTYTFLRQSLLTYALEDPIESLAPAFVGRIEQMWKMLKLSVFHPGGQFMLPILGEDGIKVYLDKLLTFLESAYAYIKTTFYNKGCSNRDKTGIYGYNRDISSVCKDIPDDIYVLERVIAELSDFIELQQYDEFKDRIKTLAGYRLLSQVIDAINHGDYGILRNQMGSRIRELEALLKSKISTTN